jgi:hypothetical protein
MRGGDNLKGKIGTIFLAALVLVSMFAVLQIEPVKATPEDDLYYYASQLSVKIYRDGQYWETRDFQYKTHWYAYKLLYNYGRRMQSIIKFYKTPLTYYNASWNTAHFFIVGMEDDYWGGDLSFDDCILEIGADYADNGQKLIFIDCMFTSGLYKEVYYQGKMILNSTHVRTDCTELGWAFYDDEYPEYSYANGNWSPTLESETSDIVNYPFPSVKDLAENIRTVISAWDGSQWQDKASRFWLESPADNTNKWWLKWMHYFYRDTTTCRYETLIVGIEDLSKSDAIGDSYADVLIDLVYFYDKTTGISKYEYTWCHITGGFNKKLYWKSGNQIFEIFEGYPTKYKYNYIIDQGTGWGGA